MVQTMASIAEAMAFALRQHQAGNLQQAERIYRDILQIEPQHADALHFLGISAYQGGRSDLAVGYLEQSLRVSPGNANFLSNLGLVYQALGRRDEAADSYRQAVELQPTCVSAHINLGNLFREKERWDQAADCYRRALQIDPNHADAHNSLGLVLYLMGRADEALSSCRQALRLRPGFPEAHNNLGMALQALGQLDEALTHLQQADQLKPNCARTVTNLGNIFQLQGKLDEAIAHYRQALRLEPTCADALMNLAGAFQKQGLLDDALPLLEEVVRLRPNDAQSLSNRGLLLKEQGQLAAAHASFREALKRRPDDAVAHSNLLFCLSHDPDADPEEVFAEHCRWGALHGKVSNQITEHANDPTPGRRLRIGYVSADFRGHVAAYFFEPILVHHDPAQVEVFCYANVSAPDATTARLQSQTHVWRSIYGWTDAQVVDLVRSDRIDILVDLSGHTDGNRLTVFAHKPAPVQVTYLGYPNTTGLKTIDYRLTDAVVDPPARLVLDTEELVRLPQSGCFALLEHAPAVSPLPARRSGRITFGSLHRLSKINPHVVRLWSRILETLPSAHLIIFPRGLSPQAKEELNRQFLEQGIQSERLDFRGKQDPRGHLAVYEEIDVTLDTFPFGGGTTLCESLWLGVPALTLRGNRPAGRVGASLLTCAGLTDWIAETPEQYVTLAGARTAELDRLAGLRAGLRQRMRATLCNGEKFTRSLEVAYREMWRRWCRKSIE